MILTKARRLLDSGYPNPDINPCQSFIHQPDSAALILHGINLTLMFSMSGGSIPQFAVDFQRQTEQMA